MDFGVSSVEPSGQACLFALFKLQGKHPGKQSGPSQTGLAQLHFNSWQVGGKVLDPQAVNQRGDALVQFSFGLGF
jgi:hypothetical protein